MAQVIITLKIMPENTDVSLEQLEEKAKEVLKEFNCSVHKKEIVPIAFGLSALRIIFIWGEEKGDTEKLENKLSEIEGVMSVQVEDVRRAIG